METFLKNKSNSEIIDALNTYFQQESNDVLNAVSHDVKNPLGIIELSLGLLEDRIEPLLIDMEEAQAEKIKNFFKNISIGIERSQEILENTILIRSAKASNEKKKISIHKFFDSFSIYAKPSFKRAKLSPENSIDPLITKEFNIKDNAILLIHFLKYLSESVTCENHITMRVEYREDTFNFTLTSITGANVSIQQNENDDQFLILTEKLNHLAKILDSKFTIENTSEKVVTGKLSWPKA